MTSSRRVLTTETKIVEPPVPGGQIIDIQYDWLAGHRSLPGPSVWASTYAEDSASKAHSSDTSHYHFGWQHPVSSSLLLTARPWLLCTQALSQISGVPAVSDV